MKKNIDPNELASIVAKRSECSVKVGAVIYDDHGIFSWGWNHSGSSGFGECAERHAIKRANRKRLKNATICVVSIRRGKVITSLPCMKCAKVIQRAAMAYVIARSPQGFVTTYKV